MNNCGVITCNRRQWTSVNGKHKRSAHDTRNATVVVETCGRQRDSSIAVLHLQSLRRFAWKIIALVSQTCVLPASVTWLQLSHKKTNPGNFVSVISNWLIICPHDFASSLILWHVSARKSYLCPKLETFFNQSCYTVKSEFVFLRVKKRIQNLGIVNQHLKDPHILWLPLWITNFLFI